MPPVAVADARAQFLGLPALYHGARERMHLVKGTVGVISIAVDLQSVQQQKEMHEQKGTLTDEVLQKLEQEAATKSADSAPPVKRLGLAEVLTVRALA